MSHKDSTKVIVTPSADMHKPTAAFAKSVADALGVCVEDVVVIPQVSSLTFATIPADLIAARAKADADAKKAADAAADAEAEAAAVVAARERAAAAVKAEADAKAAKELEAATKAELAKEKKAEKAHA